MTDAEDEIFAEEERRAEDVFDRVIRPSLRPEDAAKFVAVAYESGDYEIDASDFAAADRLRTRRPGARIWLMRADRTAAYRLRGRSLSNPCRY